MERKRYIPDIVAPRYQLRVRDLAPGHYLHVRCDGCRRIALIEAAELARKAPEYSRIIELAKSIHCVRCPAGTPANWSIYREE
ncbi:hypothetical protein [Rubrimonas cliftonensis]|uniref:Uncharacterized protein n=1 Tax=Rubrimonas cliftonensis TaxID=89524 RepID=A0A1H4EP17_9RHOB|nr:hypothetical protein [Rubrimonas cliftonensis]SEA86647.1 hypothetical protein SAMN05444370_11512 [Rubrimonas cliftonensis]